jgi:uridylate kinase
MPPFSLMLDEGSRSKKPYRWQRVLLKVSGEALAGDHTENIDPKVRLLLVEHYQI